MAVSRIDVWEMGCCVVELQDSSWLDEAIHEHPQHQADDADLDRVLRQAAAAVRPCRGPEQLMVQLLQLQHPSLMRPVQHWMVGFVVGCRMGCRMRWQRLWWACRRLRLVLRRRWSVLSCMTCTLLPLDQQVLVF